VSIRYIQEDIAYILYTGRRL